MELNEYQALARRTAAPKDKKNELFHLLLGLRGESGEIAEKAKKIVRDHASDFARLDLDALTTELGDVLWHVAIIADYFNISFEAVGRTNIEKLARRSREGNISGSGDDR